MKRLQFLLLVFTVFFSTRVIYSERVSLSNLERLEGDYDPELERIIAGKIKEELIKAKFEIISVNEELSKNLFKELSSRGIGFHVGGFYKKIKNRPIELYIQIYSPEKKFIIDAINSNFPSYGGLDLDPEEISKLDSETIGEISKKLSIQLKLNRKGDYQESGLNESIKNKPFSAKLQPYIKPLDEEIAKSSFSVLQGVSEVETASRTKESIFTSPATVVVVTEEDIKNKGYTDLTEVLADLPGIDIIHSNGAPYVAFYMRGYRAYGTEKILFMVDGKEHRDMYNQIVRMTRQFPLTSIKKIEVLYGPSSVVYGRDAMQGIINIITKNGSELTKDGNSTKVQIQHGSFQTSAIDTTSTGKSGKFSYAGSLKYFRSDEPDLSSRINPSFLNDSKYSNRFIWGPILGADINGAKFGRYYDPSNNQTLHANITYEGLRLGLYKEKISEGYGAAYTGDRVQNNSNWGMETSIYSLDYEKQLNSRMRTLTKIFYKENAVLGTWTESFPSKKLSAPYNSYLSNTNWLAEGRVFTFNQILEYEINKMINIQWGINFNNRLISRSYDAPGYFNSFSSSLPNDPLKYPNGFAVVDSSSSTLPQPPPPVRGINSSNASSYQDYGIYLLGNLDFSKVKLSGGVRYDRHSFYGNNINPRITGIYKIKQNNSLKLMYGEAFNEPTQVQLYGDNGGGTYGDITIDTFVGNRSLRPEKLKSGEIAYLFSNNTFFTEINSFYNMYYNSIELDLNSLYGKKMFGGEWKINYLFKNPTNSVKPISIYFNYTYTESYNSLTYDNNLRIAREGTTALGAYESFYINEIYPTSRIPLPREKKYFNIGDIARHKSNIGINFPIGKKFEIGFRGNYVGQRGLYTSNPLRNEGVKLDPFFIVNSNISYNLDEFGVLSLKINNLFNEFIVEPGIELANSGNNYYSRSLGYRNSIIPTPGRNFLLVWTLEL